MPARMSTADPVRDLNNFLQGHPAGNLVHQLSWVGRQEGPPHQATHYVAANFRGVVIGNGKGTALGLAKREAAITALEWLKNHRL